MLTELMDVELLYPESPQPRSPGIHVSSVLRQIAHRNGVLKRERAEEFGLVELKDQGGDEWWDSLAQDVQLRIAMGLAWEQWYLPQLGDVLDHPGEMEVEGIYMTHDGESLDTLVVETFPTLVRCCHEVKVTYKSLNKIGSLWTQWLWLAQMKAYCKGLNTTVCYLHVLAVCGDYTYPLKPVLRIWRVTFTQAEIDENWDVIISYVKHCQRQDAEEQMRDTI